MRTSATGIRATSRRGGFTLVELLVALSIAGLVLAVAVPQGLRFYEGMQTRSAVRDVVTLLATARERAITSGRAQDVMVWPDKRRIALGDSSRRLPASVRLTVHGSRELNRERAGVIRFYPGGSTSGGGVDLETGDGEGIAITVDWLLGRISQERFGAG